MKLQKKGMAGGIISLIIGILVLVLVAIALLPVIKTAISDASGNFTTAELALLTLIPLLLVIVIVFVVIKSGKLSK